MITDIVLQGSLLCYRYNTKLPRNTFLIAETRLPCTFWGLGVEFRIWEKPRQRRWDGDSSRGG